MENIEKYIFDPQNPKGFKAYGLLRKIFKDGDNVAFLGYNFFIKWFEQSIFDKDLEKKLWDKPNDYSLLTYVEKRLAFIGDYSELEFNEAISEKIKGKNISRTISPLIKNYFTPNNDSEEFNNYWIRKEIDQFYFEKNFIEFPFVNTQETAKTFGAAYFDRYPTQKFEIEENLLLFLSSDEFYLTHIFECARASVLFTTIEGKVSPSKFGKNIKPIYLRKFDDLFILLDFLKRDIEQSNKKSSRLKLPKTQSSHIQTLTLKNYFSIKSATFKNLNKKREIYLLGENGDGKTLLLQSILLALKGNKNIGVISEFLKQNTAKNLKLQATDSKGVKYEFEANGSEQKSSYEHIYAYGVNRFRNDSDKQDEHGFLTLFSHEEYLENPLKWLQHLDYKEAKGENPEISLEKAKEILSEILERNVEIEVTPDGVTFNERGTILEFDQLSDGYKSVLVWVSDLLARLSSSQPEVEEITDFQGIVLVDEIGMFLHPKWQRTIVSKLREWLPNIQFIFTTHSPVVVLGASKDAVFYKVYKEDGVTKVGEPVENESLSHLMANQIMTAPFLFGLEHARSNAFDEENEELDTSDSYIEGKVQEVISQRLEKEYNISEEEIFDVINDELVKYETTQTKNEKN